MHGMRFPLTSEQRLAVNSIVRNIASGLQYLGLVGRAGTGKTTCLEALIAQYPGEIVCCAPTNIATDVMRQKLDNGDVQFRTVASILKTKRKIDYDSGEVQFYTTAAEVKDRLLLIIDESSMLNNKTVVELKEVFPNAVILFVGDAGQLPPVKNEWHWKTSGKNQDETYSVFDEIPCVELTTNMRCGQGNELFDFIERVYQGDLSMPKESKLITYITRKEITEDDLSIVYRNEVRKALNQYVFEQYWDSTYQPGVKLIANETFSDLNKKKVYNSERMVINNVKEYKRTIHNLPEGAKRILHSKGVKHLQDIKISASGYSINFSTDENVLEVKNQLAERGLWKDYYSFTALYPDVSLGYSLTAHKSQGLTIDSPTLVWDDLMQASPEILQKLTYVAASRAAKSLKILMK